MSECRSQAGIIRRGLVHSQFRVNSRFCICWQLVLVVKLDVDFMRNIRYWNLDRLQFFLALSERISLLLLNFISWRDYIMHGFSRFNWYESIDIWSLTLLSKMTKFLGFGSWDFSLFLLHWRKLWKNCVGIELRSLYNSNLFSFDLW